MMTDFGRRVLAVVRRIPAGRVATYGDVAALAGRPRAWRAVGNIMRECRDPATPCHRVVGAGGALGGYGGYVQLKRELLREEGLEVGVARIRGFRDARWATKSTKRISHDDGSATKITKIAKSASPKGGPLRLLVRGHAR